MRLILSDLNLNSAERLLIVTALEQKGSIVEAAQLLGITRHALKRRIIKHRISWGRVETQPVIASTAIAVRPVPPVVQPLSQDDMKASALRTFSWFSALAPQRVWREEVAGALVDLEAMHRNGSSAWQIRAKVWSTIFWVLLNGIREIVGGFTGRKSQ